MLLQFSWLTDMLLWLDCDFESLLMVLDLLDSFQFELLAYYKVMILQCLRRINFNSLTFSYIFQVLFFQSYFYFYSVVLLN